MIIGKYFMYPGAQAALIQHAQAEIRSRAKQRVKEDLAAVLKRDHYWQFDGQTAEQRAVSSNVKCAA